MGIVALGFVLTASAAAAATYSEDPADIQNPERGFYRKGYAGLLNTSYATNAAKYVQIYGDLRQTLIYSRMSLASYRDVDHLPASLIQTFETNLANLRAAGIKAAIRFNYGGGNTVDATKARMLNHIADLAPSFQAYGDVIAYVEGGFIGDYGQWARSEYLDTDPTNDATCGGRDLPDLLDALLAAVPADRMVLIPKPRMAGMPACAPYDQPVTPGAAYGGSNLARVGIYNDGTMCGKNNGNSFMCSRFDLESEYWATQGDFSLMVGEGNGGHMGTCANDATCPKGLATPMACSTNTDCTHNGTNYGPCVLDWNQCTKGREFAARHNIVALDDGVNWIGAKTLLDGLRNDVPECFTEFSKKLGYRYVLTQADWPPSATAGTRAPLSFSLRNDGYARLYNPRTAYLSLISGAYRRDIPLASDPRRWAPNGATTAVDEDVLIPADVAPGVYTIALSLPDAAATLRTDPRYAIRFANVGTWDPVLGTNVLGTITVAPPSGVPTTTTTTSTILPPTTTTTSTLPLPTTTTTLGDAPPTTTTTFEDPTTSTTTTTTTSTTTTTTTSSTTTTSTTTTTTTTSTTTTTTTTLPPAAAVQIDTASMRDACGGGASDTLTVASVPVGSQANRVLVVAVGAEDENADCNLALSQVRVTYANQALARATSAISGTTSWRTCNGLFYLLNPPTGTANVRITFAKTASGQIDNRHAGAFVIHQAAQAAPIATASAGSGTATNPVNTSLDVTVAGALVVDVISQGEVGAFTPQGVGQTERWDRACTSSGSAGSTLSVASAGVTQLGWSHTSPRRFAHSIAAFRPAP